VKVDGESVVAWVERWLWNNSADPASWGNDGPVRPALDARRASGLVSKAQQRESSVHAKTGVWLVGASPVR